VKERKKKGQRKKEERLIVAVNCGVGGNPDCRSRFTKRKEETSRRKGKGKVDDSSTSRARGGQREKVENCPLRMTGEAVLEHGALVTNAKEGKSNPRKMKNGPGREICRAPKKKKSSNKVKRNGNQYGEQLPFSTFG